MYLLLQTLICNNLTAIDNKIFQEDNSDQIELNLYNSETILQNIDPLLLETNNEEEIQLSSIISSNILITENITLNLKQKVSEDEVRAYLTKKCDDSKYVTLNNESLVSLDYEQMEESAAIDMQWLKALDKTIKIVLWYDNEWGYSARVLDLAKKLSEMCK